LLIRTGYDRGIDYSLDHIKRRDVKVVCAFPKWSNDVKIKSNQSVTYDPYNEHNWKSCIAPFSIPGIRIEIIVEVRYSPVENIKSAKLNHTCQTILEDSLVPNLPFFHLYLNIVAHSRYNQPQDTKC